MATRSIVALSVFLALRINPPMMAAFLCGPFEEEVTALLEEEPD